MQYKGVLKVLILIAAAAKVGDVIRGGQKIVRRLKRSSSCAQCRDMDVLLDGSDDFGGRRCHPSTPEQYTTVAPKGRDEGNSDNVY